MEFNTLIESLNKLKEQLQLKKEAIIKKELEKLNNADEEIKAISEFLAKNNYIEAAKSCSSEEKQEIKAISGEIKKLEENNEILIKHSLDVINGLLSGILNIANKESCSYNSKGKNCAENDPYNSSITEEA